ncbi:MAG: protocatechuate 3,4-dioxygenase subunit beta [Acidimicrobiia bacterium]|jgi:protocatechuate 3,4-dioxygenase beta subunit
MTTEPVIRHYGPKAYSDYPPFNYPDYKSTVLRGPSQDLLTIVQTLSETTGPGPVWAEISEDDADLTTNAGTGEPAIGERIIVTGRVYDEDGNGLPGIIIEIWQANACGRYVHWRETAFPAPLDPNFLGVGQCMTDENGEYRFMTIKPGPYPWANHPNAWRPAHIHISLLGPSLGSRLVTQMYFENDPLFPFDPIYNSVPEHARDRMIAKYDHDVTEENWALGWRWDIVLRGKAATPFETGDDE